MKVLVCEGKNVFHQETLLKDAYIIDVERLEDNRGFFARIWCKKEFTAHGLSEDLVQFNIGFSKRGCHRFSDASH
jgi:dTDP-4-dehydrorhamnose 3,5-epimerase-like enzyme